MIDSIYILSLEHDKPRRQRLLNLIKNERNKSLINKTKIVKGIYHPQINDNFLKANKLDYYRNWKLTKEESDKVVSKYGKGNAIHSCQKFYCEKLKKGQIASLIGHIECWKQMVLNNDEYALIFEDDAWWPPESCLSSTLDKFFSLNPDFDIFYLGRNALLEELEEDSDVDPEYVIPKYSYNNQSYVFSRKAALKVLAQDPHKNLMSSDEFLPACYDNHPRKDIRKLFKKCLKKPLALRAQDGLAWQMNTPEIAKEQGITWSNIDDSKALNVN